MGNNSDQFIPGVTTGEVDVNSNFVTDRVLFREINKKIPVNNKKGHGANKIYRNSEDLHVAFQCNCGEVHPIAGIGNGNVNPWWDFNLSHYVLKEIKNGEVSFSEYYASL